MYAAEVNDGGSYKIVFYVNLLIFNWYHLQNRAPRQQRRGNEAFESSLAKCPADCSLTRCPVDQSVRLARVSSIGVFVFDFALFCHWKALPLAQLALAPLFDRRYLYILHHKQNSVLSVCFCKSSIYGKFFWSTKQLFKISFTIAWRASFMSLILIKIYSNFVFELSIVFLVIIFPERARVMSKVLIGMSMRALDNIMTFAMSST